MFLIKEENLGMLHYVHMCYPYISGKWEKLV